MRMMASTGLAGSVLEISVKVMLAYRVHSLTIEFTFSCSSGVPERKVYVNSFDGYRLFMSILHAYIFQMMCRRTYLSVLP